jgi:hypothetical protein
MKLPLPISIGYCYNLFVIYPYLVEQQNELNLNLLFNLFLTRDKSICVQRV